MKTDIPHQEQAIANLLRYGTWLASALIAAGLLLALAYPADGHGAMKIGIAVFILLPVIRVALMLALFLRERDYTYAAIAALVLSIIAAGVLTQR